MDRDAYTMRNIQDYDEQLIKVEASAHRSLTMTKEDGSLLVESDRITIYSESGKHGFALTKDLLISREERTNQSCGKKLEMVASIPVIHLVQLSLVTQPKPNTI